MGNNRLTTKKIVCLGGGIGTVNLIRGLKHYPIDLTVVVSMADDGGSAGRLRRLYGIFPPGDVVSCMAALAPESSILPKLLTYRFAGDRYGKDAELGGHKLGNLLLTAFTDMQGDFQSAIASMQQFFQIQGTILPATAEQVTISAKTIQNRHVYGEEKIDLGKYLGKRILEQVFLHPEGVKANTEVIKKIREADVIILGPGDLYTALLPVLIVKEIAEAVKKAKGKKIYIVNIANKPYETRGYSISDYISAIKRHIDSFPFDTILLNKNYNKEIPKKYHYQYVKKKRGEAFSEVNVVEENLVDASFPLYHDSEKLAKAVWQHI